MITLIRGAPKVKGKKPRVIVECSGCKKEYSMLVDQYRYNYTDFCKRCSYLSKRFNNMADCDYDQAEVFMRDGVTKRKPSTIKEAVTLLDNGWEAVT